MGMRKKMMKGVGYAAAPKATFAALNPGKAAMVKAASWTMDRVSPSRRRRSRTRSTMAGIGAAAVAIPVGFFLGRRFLGDRQTEHRLNTGS
ncbi:MAG: hypothetical protein WD766_15555 [Gemmatimonadota bacterium]